MTRSQDVPALLPSDLPMQLARAARNPRAWAALAVTVLHVLLIGAVLAVLHTQALVLPAPPMTVVPVVPVAATAEPPPPAAPPELRAARVVVPAPLFEIDHGESTRAITVVAPPRALPPGAGDVPFGSARVVEPVWTLPQLVDPAAARPPYPATSRRLGEHGSVLLGFVVEADGRVRAGSVTVLAGSGYPRLDAAALAAVARLHFLPGTRDGRPTPMQHRFRMTFTLAD
jgi:protein TonB